MTRLALVSAVTILAGSIILVATLGARSPATHFDSNLLSGAEGMTVIPVSNLERSKTFYEKLGCTVELARDQYALLSGGGIRIRLVPKREVQPAVHPLVVWRFARGSEWMNRIRDSGIKPIAKEEVVDWIDTLDAFPPGGVVCYFLKDPDGSILALLEAGPDK